MPKITEEKPITRTELVLSVFLLVFAWLASVVFIVVLTLRLIQPYVVVRPLDWALYAVLVPALALIPVQLLRYVRSPKA